MIKMTDVQARLRLLRYGLLVVVIITFLVTLTYPVVALRDRSVLQDFLLRSLLYSVVVAVICAAIYFGYRWILLRTVGPGDGGEK